MAVVDDAEAWRRQIAGLMGFYAALAAGSDLITFAGREGLGASATPAIPQRSLLNAVVYEDAAGLARAYDGLAESYAKDGVAWTVWVPDHDTASAELLAENGHVLDADPEALILDLDEVERPPEPAGFARGTDLQTVGRINDHAYGLDGEFERACAGHGGEDIFVLTAGDGPDACVVFTDDGDDAAVWMVATEPAARGRGLSTALMAHGLADARKRGRTTSTLQATDAGKPVYERLGYRSLGEIQMWEKRA